MLLRSIGLAVLLAILLPWSASGQNTLVVEGMPRYQPTGYPDRIVLTFAGDPATVQAVSWRTSPSVTRAVAEIAVAGDSPALHLASRAVEGTTVPLDGGNGLAHHHRVVFSGLRPNTLYAYRVGGDGTWSEWLQFRTARSAFDPFTFLYFGDAQNAVKSHFSRTLRQASLDRPGARLMVHAGDLVNQYGGNADDEWAEWFDAGGWIHGMIPSLPATGNHDYLFWRDEGGVGIRELSPHWPAQFGTPGNGPEGMRESVYFVDYQGVRFIVLNTTEVVYDDAVDRAVIQARWLESVLRENPNRWTVVVFHHPVFSVGQGRDNPILREHWKPLLDRYGVDLVLQGHDHTYGRGGNVPEGTTAWDGRVGTMYVVSVAGPKMYFVSDAARETLDRVGEDTQLYQTIRVEWDRLVFEARTTTGRLYDSFELHKEAGLPNRLVDLTPPEPERRCGRPDIPGYREDRCWEGTDFIRLPEPARTPDPVLRPGAVPLPGPGHLAPRGR